jgi:hypothetical protein
MRVRLGRIVHGLTAWAFRAIGCMDQSQTWAAVFFALLSRLVVVAGALVASFGRKGGSVHDPRHRFARSVPETDRPKFNGI